MSRFKCVKELYQFHHLSEWYCDRVVANSRSRTDGPDLIARHLVPPHYTCFSTVWLSRSWTSRRLGTDPSGYVISGSELYLLVALLRLLEHECDVVTWKKEPCRNKREHCKFRPGIITKWLWSIVICYTVKSFSWCYPSAKGSGRGSGLWAMRAIIWDLFCFQQILDIWNLNLISSISFVDQSIREQIRCIRSGWF